MTKPFPRLIDNLMETKEKLLLEMKAMDQTTEHLKQFLVPQQVAKFLLLSDKVCGKLLPNKTYLIEQNHPRIRHFPPLGDQAQQPS